MMWFFYMILVLTSSTSTLVTRNMKMKTLQNSFYQLGYFGNFIGNITAQTLMRCAIACQNNDQCRLANYNSQTLICSLIDESSFVGQIISSSSETSVIILQLCEDPTKQEPEYLCFGSSRPAVTVQYAIDNARSVRNISLTVYIARFSSTGLLYIQKHNSDTMYVYELETYTQINQLQMFSGQNKRNFDADFAQNYYVFTGYASGSQYLYVVSSLGNMTISSSSDYYGVCLSDRYIIVTRKTSGSLIDVFERSDGSLAFQISVAPGYNACGVIRDQLFILTDSNGMKSTNIVNRTGATITNLPIGSYRQGLTNMAIDSSGRTYTVCANCPYFISCMGYSVCSIVSNGLNNTQLATLSNYWYTAGRASKYKYRFVGADSMTSTVAIFEY